MLRSGSVRCQTQVPERKIAPNTVVCIAELPKRLEVRRDESMIQISISRAGKNQYLELVSDRDEAKNSLRVTLSGGRAQVKSPAAKNVMLKLFSDGYLLDEQVILDTHKK